MGVTEPQATFSPCFGGPFLVWHPSKYAELLAEKMRKHKARVWLVNTGWAGGGYGVGKRISLKNTRAIIDAIHSGALANAKTERDPVFGFDIVTEVPGVPPEILRPREAWADKSAYDATAKKLASLFNKNFETYAAGASAEVKARRLWLKGELALRAAGATGCARYRRARVRLCGGDGARKREGKGYWTRHGGRALCWYPRGPLRQSGRSSHARFRQGVRIDSVVFHNRTQLGPGFGRTPAAGHEIKHPCRGRRPPRRSGRAGRLGWRLRSAAVLGIFSGASTNTPSLGAGTQTLSTLPDIAADRLALPALAYAVTYPMAIVGIIGTLLVLKQIFRVDPPREGRIRGKEPPSGRTARTPYACRHQSESRGRATWRDPRACRIAGDYFTCPPRGRNPPPPTRR